MEDKTKNQEEIVQEEATVEESPLNPTMDVSTMSMLSLVTRSHTDCIPEKTFI